MSERSPSNPPAATPAGEPFEDEHRETIVAVFGDTSRAGAWYPPERLVAIAGFGSVTLDFRDADLPAGPTEIRPFAVFGNVQVIVPRHVDVELNGVSLFGSIKHTSDRKAGRKLLDRVLGKPPPEPAAPPEDEDDRWLEVQGWAVFGNVTVKVVDS
ncbi:MAG: hypothetical protein JRH10_17515 [Deltaproteobacteria bacterium]|nr:hypothetical protein [Deltaproteobacteria bacterium]MBW2448234.1 hypothetical protein [Deltaproteobacteria bacterium]